MTFATYMCVYAYSFSILAIFIFVEMYISYYLPLVPFSLVMKPIINKPKKESNCMWENSDKKQ